MFRVQSSGFKVPGSRFINLGPGTWNLKPGIIKMGRILGIDYGRKRIGLAVTDPFHIFASPLATVSAHEFEEFMNDYMKKEEVEAFVVGYPVNLNNHPSESVKYIDPFIRRLEKSFPDKRVHLTDERFTSQMAIRTMIEGGVKKKGRREKEMIDRISASIILQSFLDRRSAEKLRKE